MTLLKNRTIHQDLVSTLLTYVSPTGYGRRLDFFHKIRHLTCAEFHEVIGSQLEQLTAADEPEAKVGLFKFYVGTFRQWSVQILAGTTTTDMDESLNSLVETLHVLASTIMQQDTTVAGHAIVLDFYESLVHFYAHPALPSGVRISLLPEATVYTILFSQSLSSFSRLCYVLAQYKRAFELAAAPPAERPSRAKVIYPRDVTLRFNGYIKDACNCLWRSQAFSATDSNSRGCMLPRSTYDALESFASSHEEPVSLSTLFGLSYSPLTCAIAIAHVRHLEDQDEPFEVETRHAGPVTKISLAKLGEQGGVQLSWDAYRLGVLAFLENRGVTGISELLYNSIKALMASRQTTK